MARRMDGGSGRPCRLSRPAFAPVALVALTAREQGLEILAHWWPPLTAVL